MASSKGRSGAYILQEETNGPVKLKDHGTANQVDGPADDGYNWRKYGQKILRGIKRSRSYYKCTHPNCESEKILDCSAKGQIEEIAYIGTHDHPKPQPSRRVSAGSLMSTQEEDPDKLECENYQAGLSSNNGQNPDQEACGTPLQSPRQANQESREEVDDDDQYSKKRRTDTGTLDITPMVKPISEPHVVAQTAGEVDKLDDVKPISEPHAVAQTTKEVDHPKSQPSCGSSTSALISIQEEDPNKLQYENYQAGPSADNGQNPALEANGTPLQSPRQANEESRDEVVDDDDESYSKQRRTDACTLGITPMVKAISGEAHVGVQMTSKVGIPDDGFRWRKYGQKLLQGNPNPRSYYRCTTVGCTVKKHVERAPHDPKEVITTYEGKHNHDVPVVKANHELTGSGNQRTKLEEDDAICLDLEVGSRLRDQPQAPNPGTPHSQNSHLQASGTPLQSPRQAEHESRDEGDVNDDDQYSKKRRTDICTLDVTPVVQPIHEPRVGVKTTSEVEILDDGCRWRKYGQKLLQGNPNPRSYYKCTTDGCPVRKHVERAPHDPKEVITTYEGKHNHDVPVVKANNHDFTGSGNQQTRFEENDAICLDLEVGSRLRDQPQAPNLGILYSKVRPSPTTGSFFKSQMMQRLSGIAACSSSSRFQLGDSTGQYHNHNQNKNRSEPRSYASTSATNWDMASSKEKSTPHEEINGPGKLKDHGTAIQVDSSSDDGYNWSKYGQKFVKELERPRSYYKCTHPNCEAKKKVDRSCTTGQIEEIVYKGTHDHPKPQLGRRFSAAALMTVLEEDPDKLKYENYQTGLSVNDGQNPHLEASGTPLQSPRQANQESRDEGDVEDDDQYSKKRRTDISTLDATPVVKPIHEPRVGVQTTSQVDIPDDGCRWRKYGQKVVQGNPNPRSYYKCTKNGCPVRKHVERAPHDPKEVIITYEGKHNHDVPVVKANNHDFTRSGNQRIGLEENNAICLDLEVGSGLREQPQAPYLGTLHSEVRTAGNWSRECLFLRPLQMPPISSNSEKEVSKSIKETPNVDPYLQAFRLKYPQPNIHFDPCFPYPDPYFQLSIDPPAYPYPPPSVFASQVPMQPLLPAPDSSESSCGHVDHFTTSPSNNISVPPTNSEQAKVGPKLCMSSSSEEPMIEPEEAPEKEPEEEPKSKSEPQPPTSRSCMTIKHSAHQIAFYPARPEVN